MGKMVSYSVMIEMCSINEEGARINDCLGRGLLLSLHNL